ncbi:MAG: SET domain-containing protein [Flavobacteriales bacterium]|nr:SET domain-containing protein [Flavobacteriales bacterium]
MVHPDTEVRVVSPEIGLGVYATKLIPKGTIMYVIDEMELIFPEGHRLLTDEHYRKHIEKFSYTDQDGSRIVSWDYAKYINHYCDRNSISTGYGFEIALRDILPGEQITDDYGALNIEESMKCYCGKSNCRGSVNPNDLLTYSKKWDEEIISALKLIENVSQPLMYYVDDVTKNNLNEFLKTGKNYASVQKLYYDKVKVAK